MTRDHDPFSQALVSLRERTTCGVYAPGQPIVMMREAKRLTLSVTPVREALSCLSGEGLVERAASGGYFAPRLNAAIIRDRYGFQVMCLGSALRLAPPSQARHSVGRAVRARATFDQIVRRNGSPTLLDAYRRVALLLETFASVEARLFLDHRDEALDLQRRHADRDAEGLIKALEHYHQRRIDLAAELLEMWNDRANVERQSHSSQPNLKGGS